METPLVLAVNIMDFLTNKQKHKRNVNVAFCGGLVQTMKHICVILAVSGPNINLQETIPAHETLSMCQILNIRGFPIGSAQ